MVRHRKSPWTKVVGSRADGACGGDRHSQYAGPSRCCCVLRRSRDSASIDRQSRERRSSGLGPAGDAVMERGPEGKEPIKHRIGEGYIASAPTKSTCVGPGLLGCQMGLVWSEPGNLTAHLQHPRSTRRGLETRSRSRRENLHIAAVPRNAICG